MPLATYIPMPLPLSRGRSCGESGDEGREKSGTSCKGWGREARGEGRQRGWGGEKIFEGGTVEEVGWKKRLGGREMERDVLRE